MNAPKPRPPVTKLVPIQPAPKESTPSVKKPYIRPEHLTTRPFKGNEGLEKLKRDLAKTEHPSNHKRRR